MFCGGVLYLNDKNNDDSDNNNLGESKMIKEKVLPNTNNLVLSGASHYSFDFFNHHKP